MHDDHQCKINLIHFNIEFQTTCFIHLLKTLLIMKPVEKCFRALYFQQNIYFLK